MAQSGAAAADQGGVTSIVGGGAMVRELAVAQAHRLWRVALVTSVAATAVAHHVVGTLAESITSGPPAATESLAIAYDQVGWGEPADYLNHRL
jgi:hypothetical protein